MIEVLQFPCLKDNYGYILRNSQTGKCVCIDTPDSNEIVRFCESNSLVISQIWNTHWHPDHAGGNEKLIAKYGANALGPNEVETHGFPIHNALAAGDRIDFDGVEVEIIDLSGHTSGQIGYYIPSAKIVFVGDALFVLGCGRLFEGTAQMAHDTLNRLSKLPADTFVYCAHEYSLANAVFCESLNLSNQKLKDRILEIKDMRSKSLPTVPTKIAIELETNPFLLADFENLSAEIGMVGKPKSELFAHIRKLKDDF